MGYRGFCLSFYESEIYCMCFRIHFNPAKKIKKDINILLEKYDSEMILFEYYRKYFGNILLIIKCNDQELEFVADRGEIYCNNDFLCLNDYIRKEKKTTEEKLLELIELKLEEISK